MLAYVGESGFTTFTSKKTLWLLYPQKPSAATSRRAPSAVVVVRSSKFLPDSGCSGGSRLTLCHTSFWRLADRSQRSLCLKVGNPPYGQEREWSIVVGVPHTHEDGKSGGLHPYLRQMASLNARPFITLVYFSKMGQKFKCFPSSFRDCKRIHSMIVDEIVEAAMFKRTKNSNSWPLPLLHLL